MVARSQRRVVRPAGGAGPVLVEPMMAVLGTMPANQDDYLFEFKWDGVRAVCLCEDGAARFQSRNLLDITHRYPEVAPLGRALRGKRAVLDGEIVALDEQGRPSFSLLQTRMQVARGATASRRAVATPVVYMVFDVLYLGDRWVTGEPQTRRRERLVGLKLEAGGGAWRTSPAFAGAGDALLDAARTVRLEGVMAKRLDGIYVPGRRSSDWIKIKVRRGQEMVIGGWQMGERGFTGTLGSLALGYYEPAPVGGKPRLVYAGNVGTGFNAAQRDELLGLLRPLERRTSPFDTGAPKRGTRFAEPRLVAEIEFAEWTHEGILRQPSFKGLRADKDPRAVVREVEAGGTPRPERAGRRRR